MDSGRGGNRKTVGRKQIGDKPDSVLVGFNYYRGRFRLFDDRGDKENNKRITEKSVK